MVGCSVGSRSAKHQLVGGVIWELQLQFGPMQPPSFKLATINRIGTKLHKVIVKCNDPFRGINLSL